MKKPALVLLLFICPIKVLTQPSDPGAELFTSICAHCHGGKGQGAELGPSLLKRVAEEGEVSLATFLRKGNPARGMPPVALPDESMQSLIAHLKLLSSTVADASYATEDTSNQYASIPKINQFTPVTQEMLLNPSDNDWLWYSRTPDAQRFSPLKQINKKNVKNLSLVWSLGLPDGITETIPTVYNGIMYVTLPGSTVAALDAATGDTIWHYQRNYDDMPEFSFPQENEAANGEADEGESNSDNAEPYNFSQTTFPRGFNASAGFGGGAIGRSKNLSIFADMIYFTAPDDTVIALDARTGEVRWEAEVKNRVHTSGSIVVDGKVISSGACMRGPRDACSITAHDAYSGELLWNFITTQAPHEPPGFDTWAGAQLEGRLASSWGLPGTYDAKTGLIYWGVANPMPNTRADRHGGDAHAIAYSAPADLYSNSTLALNPNTGELAWYYQHLPGDDWDQDINQERTIITTRINPNPKHVRWINPNIEQGKTRDVIVTIGEGGGIWVLDKNSGEFLWASPFPFAVDNFILQDIDVETGQTFINRELILEKPGDHKIVCYFNTRSFWPTSYRPKNNSLYVPYIRNCLNMTAATPATDDAPAMPESRIGIVEPGVSLEELNGLAKINMETGEVTHWPLGVIPTNSAMLATAGDLIFMGDINRRYWAMDADTGEILWETVLGGPISVSNITFAVDGRQYIAVITGNTLSYRNLNIGNYGPIRLNLKSYDNNAIYVFALPQK